MGRNYKNWRRCNFSKEKLKVKFIYLFLFLVFITVILYFYYLNNRLGDVIDNYVDIEVERIFTNIVNRVLRENNVKFNDYLIYNIDSGKYNISYDVDKANEYTDLVSDKINKELFSLEIEDFSNYYNYKYFNENKYKHVRKGLLYEFNTNSINNNVLFGNIGCSIPIKISFMGSVNSNIVIKSKDYGINNVIIEAYLNINVKSFTSMPIGSKVHDVAINELIFVDVINGKVPNYYGGKLN